jgi:hypothetical protein
MDGNGRIEMIMYREIVQMKQDQIIPISRCQNIVSQYCRYCRHCSSAGIIRYITFREPRALEAWNATKHECTEKWTNYSSYHQGKVPHSMFLSGNMDDDSNCEASIISFPKGKTMKGQTAKGVVRNHTEGGVCENY